MPWTKDDVGDFKDGLTEDQKERWVEIANDALERCLEDGGQQTECEAEAIRKANGVVDNMENQIRICTEISGDIHRETKYGREYLVAPVVAVTEGVLKGEFLPGEEIENAAPIFNDKPLPVGHPKDESGEPLSAQNREIIENQSVGRFWDVKYEDNKLKGNLWVDIKKAKELGGQAEEVLNKLENNEQIDVSTAYWPDVEKSSGIYNGEKYEGVQRNLTPDHLALLPDTKGECSWEDGCGAPRINEDGGYMEQNRRSTPRDLVYSGTTTGEWSAPNLEDFGYDSVGEMSQEEKESVAEKSFLGDARADTFNQLYVLGAVEPNGDLNESGLESVKTYAGRVEGISNNTVQQIKSKVDTLLAEEFDQEMEEQQAQNIAEKVWSNLKQHFRGETMSDREKHLETLKENGVDVESVNADELSDDELENWAGAYNESDEPDEEPDEEPEANKDEEEDEEGDEVVNEKVEELEAKVNELKDKLEAQEEETREDYKETIKANSDWKEDELEEFETDKLAKLADTVKEPQINMKGKAKPRDYEDDDVEEREPVIANKRELEDE